MVAAEDSRAAASRLMRSSKVSSCRSWAGSSCKSIPNRAKNLTIPSLLDSSAASFLSTGGTADAAAPAATTSRVTGSTSPPKVGSSTTSGFSTTSQLCALTTALRQQTRRRVRVGAKQRDDVPEPSSRPCHSRATSDGQRGIQRTTTVTFAPPRSWSCSLDQPERIPRMCLTRRRSVATGPCAYGRPPRAAVLGRTLHGPRMLRPPAVQTGKGREGLRRMLCPRTEEATPAQ
jgi:hypothetical protein